MITKDQQAKSKKFADKFSKWASHMVQTKLVKSYTAVIDYLTPLKLTDLILFSCNWNRFYRVSMVTFIAPLREGRVRPIK